MRLTRSSQKNGEISFKKKTSKLLNVMRLTGTNKVHPVNETNQFSSNPEILVVAPTDENLKFL